MSGKKGQKGLGSVDINPQYSQDFIEELDGRVRTARTLKDRLRALASDLGGVSELSYQERSLVKRCIHLERLIEKQEMTLAQGGTVNDQSYYSGITTLTSLFSKLGLRRRARPVENLMDYTKAKMTEVEQP